MDEIQWEHMGDYMPVETRPLVDAFAEAEVPCHLDFETPLGGYVRVLTAASHHELALQIVKKVFGNAPAKRSHHEIGSLAHPESEDGGSSEPVLEIDGVQRVRAPTPDDIRLAVEGLDAAEGGGFLILSLEETKYLQLAGNQDFGYSMEYQVDSVEQHYGETSGTLTQAQVIAAFVDYLNGGETWKTSHQWQQMKL